MEAFGPECPEKPDTGHESRDSKPANTVTYFVDSLQMTRSYPTTPLTSEAGAYSRTVTYLVAPRFFEAKRYWMTRSFFGVRIYLEAQSFFEVRAY